VQLDGQQAGRAAAMILRLLLLVNANAALAATRVALMWFTFSEPSSSPAMAALRTGRSCPRPACRIDQSDRLDAAQSGLRHKRAQPPARLT